MSNGSGCAIAASSVLRFERQRGLILESRLGEREEAVTEVIERSRGKGTSEIERLLVRPLDLKFPVVRNVSAASELKVRG